MKRASILATIAGLIVVSRGAADELSPQARNSPAARHAEVVITPATTRVAKVPPSLIHLFDSFDLANGHGARHDTSSWISGDVGVRVLALRK